MKINYGSSVLVLPLAAAEAVNRASKRDIKVLMYIAADPQIIDRGGYEALAQIAGCSESEAESAVAFWRGVGIIDNDNDTSVQKKSRTEKISDLSTLKSESKKLKRDDSVPHYTSDELTKVLESRKELPEFIDACQQTLGKIFNTHEINIVIGLCDYLGLDTEYILLLLSHCVKIGKKNLHYIEKTAFGLYDNGITDTEVLIEHLKNTEALMEFEGQIRAMFGMKSRAMTTKEKESISKWLGKMGYGIDIIKLAYDQTVDSINSPSIAYANTILERWYSAGYKTVEDIKRSIAEYKESKTGVSFETDDFFEAALTRSIKGLDNIKS